MKPLETVDIDAFGHRFKDLPPGIAEELITLEKEGALYAHYWDDGSSTFKYYRVPLLPAEIVEFVEAARAQQEFAASDAGDLEGRLKAVTDFVIAQRVRSYGDYAKSRLKNGLVVDIRGCFASFLSRELEALVTGNRPDRYTLLPHLGSEKDRLALLSQMVNAFPITSGFLANRMRGRPGFVIDNEYDVQDRLYVAIRSVFEDARKEEWTPSLAGSAKRIDIVLPSINAVYCHAVQE